MIMKETIMIMKGMISLDGATFIAKSNITTNMKRHLLFLILVIFAIGCSKYDDSQIKTDITELEQRIATLENLCSQLNTNVTSLQSILSAVQSRDAVTGVTTVEGGYKITFATASPITILNGNDGEKGDTGASGADGDDGADGQPGADGDDGKTPVVTIALFEGVYYWKIDGTWLLDTGNNKIRASATDGSNGVTPEFKIEDGRWKLSTDGGTTWSDYGVATGSSGSSDDTVFKSIDNSNDDYVILTLADNSTITLPKQKAFDITLNIDDAYGITSGGKVDVPYVITSGGDAPKMTLFTQNGWSATQAAASTSEGVIKITAPTPMADDKIIVVVNDGSGRSVMKTLTFALGVINITTSSFNVAADTESLICNLQTNADYTVEIPESAKSWIGVQEIISTKAMRNDQINFILLKNTGMTRHATIELKDNGTLVESIFVIQNGSALTYNVETAGTLSTLIPTEVSSTVAALKITGTLNATDYAYLKGLATLRELDLGGITDTSMPASCFKSSTNITKIILPSALTAIPVSAFEGSTIVKVEMPATVTEWQSRAFCNAQKITGDDNGNWVVPDNVIYIRDYACYCLYGVKNELIIGSGVKSIGDQAFNGSDYMTKLTIGENVETIGNIAFGAFAQRTSSTNYGALVIPDKVQTIGNEAFKSTSRFTSITLGKGLKTIGNNAFQCGGVSGDITIPNNVTYIGNNAFAGCSADGTLTIGTGIKELSEGVFQNMTKIKKVVIGDNVESICGSALRGLTSVTEQLILPSNLKSIGSYAFYASTFTGKLDFSNTLTSIGNFAFSNCTNLTGTMDLPSNLLTIGSNAFYGCTGFTGNLVIPNSVTSLGESAFSGCTGFNGTLTIGTGITKLNGQTFRNCSGLTGNLVIPNNITQIYEYDFAGCSGFNGTLTMPNNANFKTLYGYAFMDCSGLTGAINLPASLTHVGGYSFKNCTGFTGDLVIPDAVKTIDQEAFYGCTGLTGKLTLGTGITGINYDALYSTRFSAVQSKSVTPPTINANAFRGYAGASILNVPIGSKEAYAAKAVWNAFETITQVSSF